MDHETLLGTTRIALLLSIYIYGLAALLEAVRAKRIFLVVTLALSCLAGVIAENPLYVLIYPLALCSSVLGGFVVFKVISCVLEWNITRKYGPFDKGSPMTLRDSLKILWT